MDSKVNAAVLVGSGYGLEFQGLVDEHCREEVKRRPQKNKKSRGQARPIAYRHF